MGKRIDLTGHKFGKLTVISKAESIKDKCGVTRAMWNCKCDCGNEIVVRSETLMNGHSKSCGCLKSELRPRKDLIGKRFGRLTVLKLVKRNKNSKLVYMCQCDCGNVVEIIGSALRNGTTKSCGCYKSDSIRERATIHGLSKHKLRGVWRNMLKRCEDPNNIGYKNYGGRGITVCDEWHNLKSFSDWAFNNGYEEGLTLERKDVNGNYCPENCCWATMKEQCNNKRNNHYIEAFGEKKTLSQWAELASISYSLMSYRINKGLTVEQILRGEK